MNGEDRMQLDAFRAEVNGRLALIQRDVEEIRKEQVKKNDDFEVRLRASERWRYSLPLTLICTLIGGVIAKVAIN